MFWRLCTSNLLTPCKQVGGQPELTPSYSNKFGCVDRHLLWPWCTLPDISIALKKLYICWKMKDIFIHVPIRMVQPPKCCVCSFDWWILWYASFQHVSQPLLLHNSTNDETQSFILIWIQITSKTNDMKMQIMKLMIWKDVFKYIHHCQFKFPQIVAGKRNPEPLSCYI